MPAEVTVCIPVYNGAQFVHETLDSVLAQDYPAMRVLVSDDASTDGSAEICRAYAARDGRVSVAVHGRNVGWPANMNSLIERVETPYYCVISHDDVISPDYLSVLVRRLEQSPKAILAFSKIQDFGDRVGERPGAAALTGPPIERLTAFLRVHATTAWRGVVARERLPAQVLLPLTPRWADVYGLIDLVAAGEFELVDRLLYRKRVHGASVSGRRRGDPAVTADVRRADWTRHTTECAGFALKQAGGPADVRLIRLAALDRLFAVPEAREIAPWLRRMTASERESMVREFARGIDWDEREALGAAGKGPRRAAAWQRKLLRMGRQLGLSRPGRGRSRTS